MAGRETNSSVSNPPNINFAIPFVPQAFRVVVNANGVQPDGTNVATPDTTSALIFTSVANPSAAVPSIDPLDNRRVIVTPGPVTPGAAPIAWAFRVSVAGRPGQVLVQGSTPAPPDLSGVSWDGSPITPA